MTAYISLENGGNDVSKEISPLKETWMLKIGRYFIGLHFLLMLCVCFRSIISLRYFDCPVGNGIKCSAVILMSSQFVTLLIEYLNRYNIPIGLTFRQQVVLYGKWVAFGPHSSSRARSTLLLGVFTYVLCLTGAAILYYLNFIPKNEMLTHLTVHILSFVFSVGGYVCFSLECNWTNKKILEEQDLFCQNVNKYLEDEAKQLKMLNENPIPIDRDFYDRLIAKVVDSNMKKFFEYELEHLCKSWKKIEPFYRNKKSDEELIRRRLFNPDEDSPNGWRWYWIGFVSFCITFESAFWTVSGILNSGKEAGCSNDFHFPEYLWTIFTLTTILLFFLGMNPIGRMQRKGLYVVPTTGIFTEKHFVAFGENATYRSILYAKLNFCVPIGFSCVAALYYYLELMPLKELCLFLGLSTSYSSFYLLTCYSFSRFYDQASEEIMKMLKDEAEKIMQPDKWEEIKAIEMEL